MLGLNRLPLLRWAVPAKALAAPLDRELALMWADAQWLLVRAVSVLQVAWQQIAGTVNKGGLPNLSLAQIVRSKDSHPLIKRTLNKREEVHLEVVWQLKIWLRWATKNGQSSRKWSANTPFIILAMHKKDWQVSRQSGKNCAPSWINSKRTSRQCITERFGIRRTS